MLGHSFTQQLKLTFICSKIDDDISTIEETCSLKFSADIKDTRAEIDLMSDKLQLLSSSKSALERSRDRCLKRMNFLDDEIATWQSMEDDLVNRRVVQMPSYPKKRKRSAEYLKSRKRPKALQPGSNASNDRMPRVMQSLGVESEHDIPLTREAIEDKLDELKILERQSRRERSRLDDEIKHVAEEIRGLEEDKAIVESRTDALCIMKRNNDCVDAIQGSFAAGMENFRSLPVSEIS